ncbi:MAG: PCRF domain-containing protein, partial [Parcubacteria group bacterium]
MANPEEIKKKIEEIEAIMSSAEFWADKNRAQATIREHETLESELMGVGKYDSGGAVMTIFSGAGGDDAEDFSRILLEMYLKFFDNKKWRYSIIHKNENDHGGY